MNSTDRYPIGLSKALRLCGLRIALLAGVLLAGVITATAQEHRRLEIQIKGAAKDSMFLANYYGNRLFYTDTAVADAGGKAVFERKEGYRTGVYAVMLGTKRLEFVVNEAVVRLATELVDLPGRLTVLESHENELYRERNAIVAKGGDNDAGLRNLADKNPGTFVAKLIRMGMEPVNPPVLLADGVLDSAATAVQRRIHYWDNTDLVDPGILYAPVFQNRLDAFLAQVPHKADAIDRSLDDLMTRAHGSEEVQRYLVSWFTSRYESSADAEMSSVYVHLAQTYVCPAKGEPMSGTWVPVDKWEKVCERARIKACLRGGSRSNDLILADTTEQHWVSMHAMPQECVVIVFWSPHCSHCKVAMPALYEQYVKKLRALDVGIYAVAEATDSSTFHDWKKFIHEKGLDWVNVGIPWHVAEASKADHASLVPGLTTDDSLNYLQTWEVSGTPTYYVLDGERKVLGKPESITDMIRMVREHKRAVH
ncbi:MAG: hypothetical protein ABI432_17655 [Flavobacteriales bacterium]